MQALPKITVGVTGGVAAYKAVELVRALQRAGLDPHVVLTAGAERFVTALTFAAVSGHDVVTTLWSGGLVPQGQSPGEDAASSVEHIEQAQTTRALVIAPATADMIAKLAHGLADDFLTTMALATPAPVIVAPSMNVAMWQHPATQANVKLLQQRGVHVLGTGEGYLACGMVGAGRLADLDEIVAAVEAALKTTHPPQDLSGKTVLVTAGGTREPLDGVRFLGNRSSGRMGYALAAEARCRGAHVLLISAATALEAAQGVEVIPVETAAQMRAAALDLLPRADLILKAAAVSDFRPLTPATGKLERSAALTLALTPTEDIVAELVQHRRPGTRIVAFAAEIGTDLARGRAKMQLKGVDAIVINDVSQPGLGFDSARNAATMLLMTTAGERTLVMPETTKVLMATQILDAAVEAWFVLPDGRPARPAVTS